MLTAFLIPSEQMTAVAHPSIPPHQEVEYAADPLLPSQSPPAEAPDHSDSGPYHIVACCIKIADDATVHARIQQNLHLPDSRISGSIRSCPTTLRAYSRQA